VTELLGEMTIYKAPAVCSEKSYSFKLVAILACLSACSFPSRTTWLGKPMDGLLGSLSLKADFKICDVISG